MKSRNSADLRQVKRDVRAARNNMKTLYSLYGSIIKTLEEMGFKEEASVIKHIAYSEVVNEDVLNFVLERIEVETRIGRK